MPALQLQNLETERQKRMEKILQEQESRNVLRPADPTDPLPLSDDLISEIIEHLSKHYQPDAAFSLRRSG